MIVLQEMLDYMEAIAVENSLFYIEVTVPGCDSNEYIINHSDNLLTKADYYKSVYDAYGQHKHSPLIRIVGYGVVSPLSLAYPKSFIN